MSLSKAGRDSLANVVLMFLCKINSLRVLATAKRWVLMNESVFSMNSSYHIANELFAALSKKISAPALVDYGLPSPVRLNRGALLVLAFMASLVIEKRNKRRSGRRSLASGTGGRVGQPRLVLCRQGSGQP